MTGMRKPLRMLGREKIGYVDTSEIVADKEGNLFINREARIYDERTERTVMVQNVAGTLQALKDDVDKWLPSRIITLKELQTGDYIQIEGFPSYLVKGFDPE